MPVQLLEKFCPWVEKEYMSIRKVRLPTKAHLPLITVAAHLTELRFAVVPSAISVYCSVGNVYNVACGASLKSVGF